MDSNRFLTLKSRGGFMQLYNISNTYSLTASPNNVEDVFFLDVMDITKVSIEKEYAYGRILRDFINIRITIKNGTYYQCKYTENNVCSLNAKRRINDILYLRKEILKEPFVEDKKEDNTDELK